jgi:ubiquitin-like 1-activating enzyme E1 B
MYGGFNLTSPLCPPADEIANLREQAREMGAIRQAVLSVKEDATTEELQAVCRRTFNKIFKEDVERLLSMDGMWRKRVRPIPIEYDAASQEEESSSSALPTNGSNGNQLKDQKLLSLKETVELFDESLVALANRARANPGEPITFDKDELDTLNFVTATANLRSRIYHIAPQTRFQVKEMAGNIIPAIASTNAIIAGAQMFQLLQSFRHAWKEARFVSLNKMNPSRLVTSFACSKPSVECGVCQDDYVRAALDVSKVTLGELKEAVLQSKEEGGLGYQVEGLEIFESSRLLADEDFDDNLQKVLHEMKIEEGTMITCVDEDGAFCSVNVIIAAPASNAAASIDFRSKNSFQLREKVKIGKPAEEESDEEDIVEVVEAPIATKSTPAIKRKRSAEEDSVEAVADAEANFKRKKLSKQSGNGEEEAIELD